MAGEKVLIIDDQAFFRAMYSDLLREAHYLVFEAKDGEEGLKQAQSNPPDIIILDKVMPKMGGTKFMQEFRRLNLKTRPILIVNSTLIEEASPETLEDKAFSHKVYVPKIKNPVELLRILEGLLKRAAAEKKATRDLQSTINQHSLTFKAIPIFSSLTDDELSLISVITEEVKFRPGQKIFNEGVLGDALYVITEGQVRIKKYFTGVGDETLAVLKPGACFGEMALLDSMPRSAAAIAETDCRLLKIPMDNFKNLLESHKEIAYKILWVLGKTLSQRLREANERLAVVFTPAKR